MLSLLKLIKLRLYSTNNYYFAGKLSRCGFYRVDLLSLLVLVIECSLVGSTGLLFHEVEPFSCANLYLRVALRLNFGKPFRTNDYFYLTRSALMYNISKLLYILHYYLVEITYEVGCYFVMHI